MSARSSRLRRLAHTLVAHAADRLPAAKSPWAEAMRREIDHIEGDWNAARWALGCVRASYRARAAAKSMPHAWFARAPLAILCLGLVPVYLFATGLTVAYRLNAFELTAALGGLTEGYDYRRFRPLMEATPIWIHGLWVGASLFFFVSMLKFLRDSRAAFMCFVTGLLLALAGDLASHGTPAYREVFHLASPDLGRDYAMPVIIAAIALLVCVALWRAARDDLSGLSRPNA